MDSLVEFGRTIKIICRFSVRKIASPGDLITKFNLRGFLKSKDNLEVQVVLLLRQYQSTKIDNCRNLKKW